MRATLLLALLACPLQAGATEPKVALAAIGADFKALAGEFQQAKHVKGFAKPLRSRGSFVVRKEGGVLWSMQKPFASEVCIDGQGLWQVQRSPQGAKRSALHRGDMGMILKLVQQVLGGDSSALKQAFEVIGSTAVGADGKWALDLRPRDAALRRGLASLRLEGAKRVRLVEYVEPNGDRTRIEFSAVTELPALDKAQLEAFGG